MPDGTIYPGRYTAREFEPAVSFEVGGEGRYIAVAATTDAIVINGPKRARLIFIKYRYVFDPSNLSEAKEVPAPENTDEWVSWFQRHPNLDTSKPVPVRVGSASGKQIDVMVTSPENYPKDLNCGGQYPCVPLPCVPLSCVPLYISSDESSLAAPYDEDWKNRFIIVDVEGETVVIDVAAPVDEFDEFAPKAQKVLDSVEWNARSLGRHLETFGLLTGNGRQ
jgi:hypothetical protein